MKWQGFSDHGVNPLELTPMQRDGRACVVCNGIHGAMLPATFLDGTQTFVHAKCIRATRPRPIVASTGAPAMLRWHRVEGTTPAMLRADSTRGVWEIRPDRAVRCTIGGTVGVWSRPFASLAAAKEHAEGQLASITPGFYEAQAERREILATIERRKVARAEAKPAADLRRRRS